MTEETPHIRTCRTEDLGRIIAITGEVFAAFAIDAKIEAMLGPAGGASWLEIKADAIRGEIRAHPAGCFVAETGGEVVGYVTTTIHRAASRGVIANIAVSARAQRGGIGRRLLHRALEHFRSIGLAQAKIETLTCNPAGLHLYPSVGFREVARQVHYVVPLA